MQRPASRRANRPNASPREPLTSPHDSETAPLPYGPNPYQQGPYQQQQGSYEPGPYEQGPYQQAPYEQAPYEQAPYEQAPYEQAPYEQAPYGQAPYEQAPGGPGRRGPGRGRRRGAQGPGGPKARKHRVRRLFRRRSVRVIAALLAVFCCWLAFSLGQALTSPDGGSVSSKLAEWARDHYLGPVVTFGEWISYSPPKVGGKPSFSLAVPSAGSAKYKHTKTFKPIIPSRLSSPAGTPVPGEGQWRVLETVKGEPGHLRHLPAAIGGIHVVCGGDRVDGPAAGHLPAAPRR